MSPLAYMILPYRRFAEFSGRSCRAEYWWFTLFSAVIYAVFAAMAYLAGIDVIGIFEQDGPVAAKQILVGPAAIAAIALAALFFCVSLLPSLAVAIRRLHDIGYSGWWYLGNLIASSLPVVGVLFKGLYIGVMCRRGTRGPNRFGADPLAGYEIDLFA